jgi:hypothetical protein
MFRIILAIFFTVQTALTFAEESDLSEHLEIDIAWGGYYASVSREDNEISVFRLLDFNRDAYHIAMYRETFESIPEKSVVKSLSPFIGHAPLDTRSLLLNKKVVLLGSEPLEREDLDGYMYYLQEFDVSEAEREKLITSLIAFGMESPLPLRLFKTGEELQIQERK